MTSKLLALLGRKAEEAPSAQALAEIAELERMATLQRPVGKIPMNPDAAPRLRAYEKVAESIGFAPAELVRDQLLEFFEYEGIKRYDYAEVSRWMEKKREEAGIENWCWRPLRAKDVIDDYQWGQPHDRHYVGGKLSLWRGEYVGGKWVTQNDGFYWKNWCPPYDRAVPQHALELVARIEARFGDQVKFFVSDYASANPDPFIMVRPAKRNTGGFENFNLVFDVWDEPGF